MADFKNFKDIKFNIDAFNEVKFINPMNDATTRMKKQQEDSFRALQESREEKEKEELRRHNEIVQTLREAGQNGATIVVGDYANGVQILQNSDGSTLTMENSQTFNYERALEVLNEIKEYFDYPKFRDTFGDQAELIQQIVIQTIDAVHVKEDPTLIQKSLKVLKDLTIGISGSLIATGILGLLSSII